ncbi:hypothetical protein BV898_03262 [Hypsibius exemplaris]|uniref:Uncharacterized protein n=1 Tax=Hypsibius exemplaris TaxID=2072580 RepID=A0A1W0X5Z9_HYPEX|nr:hypothetical protein BV898_03262 [Hypsibius exemplaris]
MEDLSCCGPRGRVQWVAAYNIVVGIINLINSGYFAGPNFQLSYADTLAGLGLTAGVLLLAAGIVLLFGLRKRNSSYFVAWLVLIVIYLIFAVSSIGFDLFVIVNYNLYGGYATYTVSVGFIFLLIQALCIWVVLRYRRNCLY